MSPRKSPHEHGVNSHVRSGKPVQNYRRGKGDKPLRSPRRSRVVGNTPLEGPYNITVSYISTSERFSVDAKNYLGALDRGLEQRDSIERPKSIRMKLVK